MREKLENKTSQRSSSRPAGHISMCVGNVDSGSGEQVKENLRRKTSQRLSSIQAGLVPCILAVVSESGQQDGQVSIDQSPGTLSTLICFSLILSNFGDRDFKVAGIVLYNRVALERIDLFARLVRKPFIKDSLCDVLPILFIRNSFIREFGFFNITNLCMR